MSPELQQLLARRRAMDAIGEKGMNALPVEESLFRKAIDSKAAGRVARVGGGAVGGVAVIIALSSEPAMAEAVPTQTSTSATAPAEGQRPEVPRAHVHVVKAGEKTVTEVAEAHNAKAAESARLSGVANGKVKPGTKIKIEERNTQVVEKNQSAWSIANAHGTTLNNLAKDPRNRAVLSQRYIHPDDVLQVPDKHGSRAQTPNTSADSSRTTTRPGRSKQPNKPTPRPSTKPSNNPPQPVNPQGSQPEIPPATPPSTHAQEGASNQQQSQATVEGPSTTVDTAPTPAMPVQPTPTPATTPPEANNQTPPTNNGSDFPVPSGPVINPELTVPSLLPEVTIAPNPIIEPIPSTSTTIAAPEPKPPIVEVKPPEDELAVIITVPPDLPVPTIEVKIPGPPGTSEPVVTVKPAPESSPVAPQANPNVEAQPGELSKVPEPYRSAFIAAGRKHNVSPALVAAIFTEENFTKTPNNQLDKRWANILVKRKDVNSGWPTNKFKTQGPFQFLPPTWRAYGDDGNGDGNKDPQNLADGAAGAAKYLAASGATIGKPINSWRKAIFAYNHANWYVNEVLAYYEYYNQPAPASMPAQPANTAPAGNAETTTTLPPHGVAVNPGAHAPLPGLEVESGGDINSEALPGDGADPITFDHSYSVESLPVPGFNFIIPSPDIEETPPPAVNNAPPVTANIAPEMASAVERFKADAQKYPQQIDLSTLQKDDKIISVIVKTPELNGRIGKVRVSYEFAIETAEMLKAAAEDGVLLTGGGFRTAAQQIAVRRANCGTSNYAIYHMPSSQCSPPTASPGNSMHEKGGAIDFTNPDNPKQAIRKGSPEWKWLMRRAREFGYKNFPKESWHWSRNGR